MIFYGLPWLQWNGRQAVLFDLGARKFYLFGVVLWPQDFVGQAASVSICARRGSPVFTSTTSPVSASLSTMAGALPPSSRVSFFFVPASERWMRLPTSVVSASERRIIAAAEQRVLRPEQIPEGVTGVRPTFEIFEQRRSAEVDQCPEIGGGHGQHEEDEGEGAGPEEDESRPAFGTDGEPEIDTRNGEQDEEVGRCIGQPGPDAQRKAELVGVTVAVGDDDVAGLEAAVTEHTAAVIAEPKLYRTAFCTDSPPKTSTPKSPSSCGTS